MPIHDFLTRRRIEFADTDLAGIVHFSRFFVFMETAEHEMLRTIDVPIHSKIDGVAIGWPRISATCEYLSPVRYGDEIAIHLVVERKGVKSLTYAFTMSVGDKVVARGRMVSVCCILHGTDGLVSIPIPAAVADRLLADAAVDSMSR